MGNAAFSVLFAHVVDDLDAAALAKVDVDVGRADPLWVEKSFEQESETHRANVGDAHRIGSQRSRRRSPAGADGNVVVARPLDEIRGDQEVRCKAELVDRIDLVLQAVGDLGRLGALRTVAFDQSIPTDFHQVLLARAAVGRPELRVLFRTRRIELERHVAALGDFQSRIARARHIRENLAHLLGRLEINFRRVVHSVFIDHQMARADADHYVVRLVVRLVEKVYIIRRDNLEP